MTETFEKISKMNGLEELVQGNSVRWMRRRSRIPSGEMIGRQQQAEQALDVLSPEMVMAEFDRQVGTIRHKTPAG